MQVPGVVVCLFFISVLILGCALFKDYGISWDESQSRINGAVTIKYLIKLVHKSVPVIYEYFPSLPTEKIDVPDLGSYIDQDYGVAFEAPIGMLEYVLGLQDSRSVYLFRHIMTFLVSVGGVYAVFRMAERRFADWRWGLLAAVLLLLSPRIFAESFYNDKDIVFMALFAISVNAMIDFVVSPRMSAAVVAAVTAAIAIDVRIMAIIVPIGAIVLLLIRITTGELPWRRTLPVLVLYGAATCGCVVLLWPWLWESPWAHFQEAFANMSKFRWHGSVLFMGLDILWTDIPWYYAPVWIGITTPVVYSAMFLLGSVVIVTTVVRDVWKNIPKTKLQLWSGVPALQDVVFFSFAVLPILAVIVLHSVIYNGWRQMYFIYPMFVLVAARGMQFLFSATKNAVSARVALVVVVLASMSFSAIWMYQAHPFEMLYFNVLAGKNTRQNFDGDYWGVTNRNSLEYLLQHETTNVITILPCSLTNLPMSLSILTPEQRARIRVTNELNEANFIVNTFQGDLSRCPDRRADLAYTNQEFGEYHRLKVDGEVVASISRRLGKN
jgi:hypothetical protein